MDKRISEGRSGVAVSLQVRQYNGFPVLFYRLVIIKFNTRRSEGYRVLAVNLVAAIKTSLYHKEGTVVHG